MKKVIYLSIMFLMISLTVLAQATGGQITRKKTNTTIATAAKKTKATIKTNSSGGSRGTGPALTPLERKVVGRHLLSLQWISWDYFGTCEITKLNNGKYKCKGSQYSKENSDYLKLDGYITIVSETHLKFTGAIRTKVYHLNNGNEYVREGSFDFVATDGRKYWREQEMNGPDGVTDYIDIYFGKK